MNRYEIEEKAIINYLRDNTVIKSQIYGTVSGWVVDNVALNDLLVGDYDKVYEVQIVSGILEHICNSGKITKNIERVVRNGKTVELVRYFTNYNLYTEEFQSNYIYYAREFNNDSTLEMFSVIRDKMKERYNIDLVMLEEDIKLDKIHDYVKESIKNSFLVISDLTSYMSEDGINVNVVYEMGLATGFGKKVIKIISDGTMLAGQATITHPYEADENATIRYSEDIDEESERIIKLIEMELYKTY